ncbi:MAG: archaellin/type IV pilin N-terminal domain-containing protein, partial [Candidatus Pacearchaeota archaeon]
MRSIIADKRGISELISYVLLTVMAIALASGVYIWIKTRIPYDYKECPEGLSMIIEECTIKEQIPNSFELNLTFKNTGNFNITGAFVYAVLSNGSITNLTTFPSNLSYLDADYLPVGEKRIYPDNQPYVLIPH